MRNELTQFARIFALALMLPMTLFASHAVFANDGEFSAPTTAPEQALHAIMRWHMQQQSQRGAEIFNFLTQQPQRNKAKDQRFEGKYTKGLIRAISAQDRAWRDKDCDGICGLDFDPVLCAQDILLPPHTYFTTRTEKANGWPTNREFDAVRAYILYRHSRAGNPYVHRIDYLLEKEHGVWKIAGVACHADKPELETKFNMQ